MATKTRSMTLLELVVALVLLTGVVMGAFGVSFFANNQVIQSERGVKVQNEAAIVLAHMTRNISQGIGDVIDPPVNTADIGGDTAIQVFIDSNLNGVQDAADNRVAYRYDNNEIRFCPQCGNNPCTNCNPNWNSTEIISNRIVPVNPVIFNFVPGNNFIEVQITARYNPAQAQSAVNPEVTLTTRIKMPAVSTN